MSQSLHYDIIIVGAGHAGAQCAQTLRQRGFDGTIALVGEEREPPYERPPLSKEYLTGDKTFERLLIRPVKFWQERAIDLLLGNRVTAVDPASHSIRYADGSSLHYNRLVWAAGGAPRRLACANHGAVGVHTIRNREDIDQITAELPHLSRVAIVGGGYIGLEAAAALTKLGKQVTVIEAQDRVLARVAAEPLSRFFENEHRSHGVDLRLSTGVEAFIAEGGHLAGVSLSSGETLPAEMAIVGIGIDPAIAPLRDAGAHCSNGVDVDPFCRTSLTDIYAVGDCAAHINRFANDARIRLESVQNAVDQANCAAKHITGEPEAYNSIPWFWSHQFDLRLQTVGLSHGHDQTILRGSPESRSFSLLYLRAGKLIAVDAVNMARDYVQARPLIEQSLILPASALSDSSLSLKEAAEILRRHPPEGLGHCLSLIPPI